MTSLSWIKWKIHQEWEESLPDRFDPERAAQDADEDGMIRNYENSYSMHHKTVEATPEEFKDLMARFKRAEEGLIVWDEDRRSLVELDQPALEGGRTMVKGLYLLHIDGGKKASAAGGTAAGAYGFVLRDPKGNDMAGGVRGQMLDQEIANPHVAEYEALLAGLEFVHQQELPYLAVFSDSRTLVNQVNKIWDASGELAEYRDKARASLDRLKGWQLSWIPRKWNEQADEQVRLAFEADAGAVDVEHAD